MDDPGSTPAPETDPPPPFPLAAVALLLLLVVIAAYVGARSLVGGPPGRTPPEPAALSTVATPASPPAHRDPVADLLAEREEPAPPASDPIRLARAGDYARASDLWARRLASGPARDGWTVQLAANCETRRLAPLLASPGLGSDAFLLPVAIGGRPCFRVCTGVYTARTEADRRAREITSRPPVPGVVARAVLLADLLPRGRAGTPVPPTPSR